MAASYIAVTLIIVLLLEAVVVGAVLYAFTRSPVAANWVLQGAGNAARIYALQAAVLADDEALNPETTFAPGTQASLSQEQDGDFGAGGWFDLTIPYVDGGGEEFPPLRPIPVALLVGPDGRVVASSNPQRYPEATEISALAAEDAALIREALAGNSNDAMRTTSESRYVATAETVWSRSRRPLGAVYIQSPAGSPPDANLFPELAAILIPSGMLWLCLMIPIGLVFGILTTNGLIRRIERLASATHRFKNGDLSTRVPVGRPDEIGQLETQFNAMAEQLVESFAQRQALAEQSARREERARIEQEMTSAHYIQKALLPEALPQIAGWELRAYYRPAREVGGDLYDFLTLPGGRIGIVIGDATGKGVPSALIMATTAAMLRAAASSADSPGRVLALVNDLLQRNMPSGMFATCFYATLDPSSGRMRYANAGHNLPIYALDGAVFDLEARGMPLGLMPEQEYADGEVTLAESGCVLFYSDGLVEAHNGTREMYGSPRLHRLLQMQSGGDGMIERLTADLGTFTDPDGEQEDDITLLTLRKTS